MRKYLKNADGLVDEIDSDVAKQYPFRVSESLLGKMKKEGFSGPISKQFLPSRSELSRSAFELNDPIGDSSHEVLPGLVHRYKDRVLLKLTHTCPVYCRFCFRREMVGPDGERMSPDHLESALSYISSRSEIREVILTGGDPLMLSTERLRELLESLRDINSLKFIRIHSRVPVVDPLRISQSLANTLASAGKIVILAIHSNHVSEICDEVRNALAILRVSGVPMVSQTVLLNEVNNSVEALTELFVELMKNGVKPYYLHHPDLAPGTSHFWVSFDEGKSLMASLRESLSGICQPKYVIDIPGGHGKVPIENDYLSKSDDKLLIRDLSGNTHHLNENENSREF